MKYDSASVHKIVLDALAVSSRRWVPGQDVGDPKAIAGARQQFELALIAPESGVVTVEPHIASVLNVEPGQKTVWYITKVGIQRVFLDEVKDSFGVAWGPDAATGDYLDLGIRTTDPVDAFLA